MIEKTKSNACNKVADGAKVDDELTNNVTEHTTNRSATNSAATKPQQASRTAEGNTSIKYEPGEVYINEQGKLVRRVRKVKKRIHNPGAPESPPLIPNRPKPRKPNSSRRCTPRSPTTKSRASINSGRPGTKKRRAKPRAAPVDYPVYIGVPSEADARSVQSELNMLSLGDMTPMEIAKMEPPIDAFSYTSATTSPSTPGSRVSHAGVNPSAKAFERDRKNPLTTASCACAIS